MLFWVSNILDPDETPSNSASHPDPSCMTVTLRQISPTLSDIEAIWKLKQTRSLADGNLFGGLRVIGEGQSTTPGTFSSIFYSHCTKETLNMNSKSDTIVKFYKICSLYIYSICYQFFDVCFVLFFKKKKKICCCFL